jgi:purine-binding chemotaxis protein CheW
MSAEAATSAAGEREFVSMKIADQVFGVEVSEIREVFQPQATSPVPLTRPEITGVLNLRGRIVTTVCARRRLGLPPRPAGSPPPMAVGVDRHGESYGLLVDSVEEVLKLPDSAHEAAPVNLDPHWASVSRGIYRLDGRLLVVLDLGKLLDLGQAAAAA